MNWWWIIIYIDYYISITMMLTIYSYISVSTTKIIPYIGKSELYVQSNWYPMFYTYYNELKWLHSPMYDCRPLPWGMYADDNCPGNLSGWNDSGSSKCLLSWCRACTGTTTNVPGSSVTPLLLGMAYGLLVTLRTAAINGYFRNVSADRSKTQNYYGHQLITKLEEMVPKRDNECTQKRITKK